MSGPYDAGPDGPAGRMMDRRRAAMRMMDGPTVDAQAAYSLGVAAERARILEEIERVRRLIDAEGLHRAPAWNDGAHAAIDAMEREITDP